MEKWILLYALGFVEQECIPVGCVPPAAVAIPGGLHQPPREQTPPEQTSPLLTESQTPVKTLPYPNFVAGGKNEFLFILWISSDAFELDANIANYVYYGKNSNEAKLQKLRT